MGSTHPQTPPYATARLLRQRLGDDVWLPVQGESMRPTIIPPAQVRLVAQARPRVGEVWAFVGAGGHIVVHRCERRTPSGYVFRGDGWAAADPVASLDVLIGRAIAVRDDRGERRLGGIDRVRGTSRYLARWARRAGRWAVSLISRGARSG
jgi:hypothetical protein